MNPWPKHPVLYEINTWVWLGELSRKYGRVVDLGTVPPKEWDAIASHGFDAVWFMGVWERSPAGIEISMRNPGLLEDFRQALPDFSAEDNVGSAYCVRRYVVDEHLGGTKGLAAARKALAKHGTRLILDFVPNHVAPDHPWVTDHPEYFIQGNYGDSVREPGAYKATAGHVFAWGRDPYFPAWADVLQLNAFQPRLRQTAIDTISEIAEQCDGIRCDMAMLMLNNIFERTWGTLAGAKPAKDYWTTVIPAIKERHREFQFIAEAYWDLEWELQQQGFDYCYDKRLYDRLEHGEVEGVRLHLCAEPAYQERLVRFLENHDEPRAAAAFTPERERAALVTVLTLPGAKLVHEGQMEGRRVRLPVFLARLPAEPVDTALQEFHRRLLMAVSSPVFRKGEWQLCPISGWPDNQSCRNLVAWCWQLAEERRLVVVNLGRDAAQARVQLPWPELTGQTWACRDILLDIEYILKGAELADEGLYVDLTAGGHHLLALSRVSKSK